MKNSPRNKIILFSFFLIIMYLSFTRQNNNFIPSNKENNYISIDPPIYELETSSSWSNFTYIHITGDNWSIVETYEWVQGNGSWNNPYIIENITMDASSSPTGSGIYIENSTNSYFEIRNCEIFDSGTGTWDAGIKIENSTRGFIKDNNCSYNGESGILFNDWSTNNTAYNNTLNDNVFSGIFMGLNSYNNTVIFNEVKRNDRYGIRVINSHSNNISYNKVDDNDSGFNGYGFYFSNADNNTISNNTAIKNEEYGMYFTSNSDNNLIRKNYFFQDSDAGIYISGCVNNTIEYNIIVDTWGPVLQAHGIHFISSSNSTIRHNRIFDCNYYGVYFESNCKYNTIFNNTIHDNSKGILIKTRSTDNTIKNNTIYRNGNDGIELSDSNSLTVKNNNIYDQGRSGINILNCNYSIYSANKLASCGFSISFSSGNHSTYLIYDNNTVNGKNLYFYTNQIGLNNANFTNAGQIILYKCSNSYLSDLNVSYTNYGLYLNNINNTYFSNINAIHCYEGIYLTYGYNNTFNNCTTSYNEAYGSINLVLSENNTVVNCTGAYGYYGLLLTNSHNNSVLYNNFSYNINNGIYLSGGCTLNLVKGNNLNYNEYTSYVFGNGITIWGGSNNTIINNTMNGNDHHGILLYALSNYNTVYNNTANDNIMNGIYIWSNSDFNNITQNMIKNNRDNGINVNWYSDNNSIVGNFISNNWDQGIYIHEYCKNNTVVDNTAQNIGASDQNNGIYVNVECDFNTILNNSLNNNAANGIWLANKCRNNTIENNKIKFNPSTGIYITGSGNNTFRTNIIYNSTHGLYLTGNSHENLICMNLIFNTSDAGIYIYSGANNNTFKDNTIQDNLNMGIGIIQSINSNNSFYNNTFLNNFIHAVDNGTYNQWDNGTIGNYWDNYTGADFDDDGIGDTPYSIYGTAGSQDNYPLWDDGFNMIFINATATGVGAPNWTWAVSQQWCSGSGTWSDPYRIENLTLDLNDTSYGINIINSNVYFFIFNITCYNSSLNNYDGGLILNNTNNGQIIYGNYSLNNYGIILWESNNITIKNLIANDNYRGGIRLENNCNNNTILNSTANSNNIAGITLISCYKNNITDNSASYNNGSGIVLSSGSTDNLINYNRVHWNDDGSVNGYGIRIDSSNFNTIINNSGGNNDWHTIYIVFSDNNTIENNTCFSNTFNGFFLFQSNNNPIRENTAYSNNFYGIEMFSDCVDNIIIDNTLRDNSYSGIYLHTVCDSNDIIDNIIKDNDDYGIRLDEADKNELHNNEIFDTGSNLQNIGIRIEDGSNGSILIGNVIYNNVDYGIEILNSADTIIRNNILTNQIGIYLTGYPEETLIEDTTIDANGNSYGIFIENANGYFTIRNCSINNAGPGVNEAGIYFRNVYNGTLENCNISYNQNYGIRLYHISEVMTNITVFNNTISNNGDYGIYMRGYQYNNISHNRIKINVGGMYLYWQSDFNTISDNIFITNTGNDIYFHANSDDNTVSDNIIISNDPNGIVFSNSGFENFSGNSLYGAGFNLISASGAYMATNTIYQTNTVNDKIVYQYISQSGLTEADFANAGQIILYNVDSSTISNVDVSNASIGVWSYFDCFDNIYTNVIANDGIYGFYYWDSDDNQIIDCITNNNTVYSGIYIYNCQRVTISGSICNGNDDVGIHLDTCSDGQIIDNNLRENGVWGLYFDFSCHRNNVTRNDITGNDNIGFRLSFSENNTIYNNRFEENQNYGLYLREQCYNNEVRKNYFHKNPIAIYLYRDVDNTTITLNLITNSSSIGLDIDSADCNMNLVYFNTFVNNSIHATDMVINNDWDNGTHGNYWDNYTGTDPDKDGIGNSPYSINVSAGIQDNYPLMQPPITLYDFRDDDGNGDGKKEEVPKKKKDKITPPEPDILFIVIILVIIIAGVIGAIFVVKTKKKQALPYTEKSQEDIKKLDGPEKEPKKKDAVPEKEPLDAFEKKRIMKETAITESEMEIKPDQDFCIIHKGPIRGIIYSCPKCGVKYCMKCASTLKNRKEGCWSCEEKIDV